MRAVALSEVPSAPAVAEAEAETPRPEAGELRVKVAVSSVNGFDAATAAGYLQGMMEHQFPLVIGEYFAGTVEALGEGPEGFTVGDAVFGVIMKSFLDTWSLAEYVTVSAGYGVAHVPADLDIKDAGALGLAGTAAFDSLTALNVAEGETTVVSGATGGVGTPAAQLAAARGAKVIATARPVTEADFVTGLTGADANAQTLTTLAEQAATGALRVQVTAAFPLAQADKAFAAFGSGALGKIAVTCS